AVEYWRRGKTKQRTLDGVRQRFKKATSIRQLRRWENQINQSEKELLGFKASETWIKRFKLIHNIVPQKVTKFVTKRSKPELENKCDTFIGNVKYYIGRYGMENIYNSEQSGFQLEFHFSRTLLYKGTKRIESVEQSISATTHSYTVCPRYDETGSI
ncbi:hypothetical protein EAI_10831, partial [Harpegnathos saltator]